MHAKRQPYHMEAAEEAHRRGVDVLVTELGYPRPDRMTLERNGNSVDSLFPVDPEVIRAIARAAPEVEEGVPYPRDAGLETVDQLKRPASAPIWRRRRCRPSCRASAGSARRTRGWTLRAPADRCTNARPTGACRAGASGEDGNGARRGMDGARLG